MLPITSGLASAAHPMTSRSPHLLSAHRKEQLSRRYGFGGQARAASERRGGRLSHALLVSSLKEGRTKPVGQLQVEKLSDVGLCAIASWAGRPGERQAGTRITAADPARLPDRRRDTTLSKVAAQPASPVARLAFRPRVPSSVWLCLRTQALHPDEPCRGQPR
jgi:hypothetical protein